MDTCKTLGDARRLGLDFQVETIDSIGGYGEDGYPACHWLSVATVSTPTERQLKYPNSELPDATRIIISHEYLDPDDLLFAY